jgi:hypothetical protein
MSRDATARAYVRILNACDNGRFTCSADDVFDEPDLSQGEMQLLREEAGATAFASDEGPVMSYLRSGPPLAQRVASDLGIALNRVHGLPTASLQEPGFRPSCECCPWGHPKIPDPLGMIE